LRAALVALDAAAIVAAWTVTAALPWARSVSALDHVGSSLAAVAGGLAALGVGRLYQSRVSSIRSVELAYLPKAALVATAAGLGGHRVLGGAPTVGWFVAGSVAVFLFLVAGRSVFDGYLRDARKRGRFCRNVVIVGGDAEAADLRELLADHAELGYRIVGCVSDTAPVDGAPPVLGRVRALDEVLASTGANGVVVTASAVPADARNALVRRLVDAGVHVHLSSGIRGMDARRLRAVPMAHEPIFYVEQAQMQGWQLWAKRAVDLVLTPVLIVVTLPCLAAAALAIKLDDRGPVFFRQTRVGQHGRHFTCLKLRTMRVGAEDEQSMLTNARSGPLFKAVRDPRITRIGRLLRMASVDELPQLFCVLRGDMSLVGPRPALPAEVAQFDEELLRRLEVPPGLTGLWQVEARDVATFEAYRRLDLHYIENWRLSLDVVLLVLTVQVVLSRIVANLLPRRRATEAALDLRDGAGPVLLD
jgi:exopolysaccharide biosynthesis polyprenyl glycosylphosphotransferase